MSDLSIESLLNPVPGTIGSPIRCVIDHPLCDTISYFREPGNHDYMESAFFMNEEWVIDIIPEFADYAEYIIEGMNTRVYHYIPRQLVFDFINKYQKV